MEDLAESFNSCQLTNTPSKNPMIEMVIPSSLDPTLAPKGSHVCLLFTQFTPYAPANGSWSDPKYKEGYAERVFDLIEGYAPGFKASVVGKEVLSPWDLEQTFNLTGGVSNSSQYNALYYLDIFVT
jgi:phytoene dehydrogenase-like protein